MSNPNRVESNSRVSNNNEDPSSIRTDYEYPSNTSHEKYKKAIGYNEQHLKALEGQLRDAYAGKADAEARGFRGEDSSERNMRQRYITLKKKINGIKEKHESRAEGRNQRHALKRLQTKLIDAKKDKSEARRNQEKAQKKKDSTQEAYDKAIKEDEDAKKAQKEEDKAAKKEKRSVKKIHTQEIQTARTAAARANNEAQADLKAAKTAFTSATRRLTALEAELEAARPPSGSHTGGTRKLRRNN
jgi:chromosome segregation ATPase